MYRLAYEIVPKTAPEDKRQLQCYKRVGDFEARFAGGAPSLVECEALRVAGDVSFGAGVVVRGRVEVSAAGDGPDRVEDGAVLGG